MKGKGKIKDLLFILWAGSIALCAYSLVYALRKPFSAGTYTDMETLGMDFKTLMAIAQITGYLIAKFAGIKVLSELKRERRFRFIFGFGLSAELALVALGTIPYPYNFIAMFFNGLSLGCMWGVIFSFLEGRRLTDVLASILGVSMVISSGLAKSAGLFFLDILDVPTFWMPAAIGAITFPLLTLSGWLLTRLPQPTAEDIKMKEERIPLDKQQRKALFRKFAPGLVLILAANFMVVTLRDIKEDFSVDILHAAKAGIDTWMFARIDAAVTLTILLLFGLMVLVRKNIRALQILLILVILGSISLALTAGFGYSPAGNPVQWLFIQGLSIYIVYLTFQTIFFDRFIACFSIKGNVVYFIALVDAIGYLGTCLILLVKEFADHTLNWLQFYHVIAFSVGIFSATAFGFTLFYLTRKHKLEYRPNTAGTNPQEKYRSETLTIDRNDINLQTI